MCKNIGVLFLVLGLGSCAAPAGTGTRSTATYLRLKKDLDAVPAIDTHEHLYPWGQNTAFLETDKGRGVNLAALWLMSYCGWTNRLTPWKAGDSFDNWWSRAKHDFENARATSMYRYQLPAFQDLYGVDFDRITDEEARKLSDRIFENYKDPRWLIHVITERANIELIFNDPFWARMGTGTTWPFAVPVFNVTSLVRGFHPSEYGPKAEFRDSDNPYAVAQELGVEVRTLDDYLVLLDRLFARAKKGGAVCLKTTLAYHRTLRFEKVSPERAAKAFGRPRTELPAEEIKAFEDFIQWRLCELSAKHELPFQFHTGHARVDGSNPMLLLDLIAENPKTKFILFHGGYPWVGESAVIVQKRSNHVWLDSVWLPMLSYSMAKRAFHEWLDAFPSNRILWGADCNHAEGIYGATEFNRQCLAEVLAEKVIAGDLKEAHALQIGKQILRDNALELFPQLKDKLWKHTGKKLEPAAGAAKP